MSAIAFIADIQGNVWALDAVLADIRRRGIAMTFNLGDSVYGPLEPAPAQPHPTFAYTTACLRNHHLKWLRDQPCTIEYADFFLCHGTPSSDETYVTEQVTASGAELRRGSDIARLLENVRQPFVLCGHSHLPRVIGLSSDRVVINPGSAGLPAYTDDVPFAHRMEAGSTHARYAIVEDGRVDLIAVSYESSPAVAKARENGRDDWAFALATGFALS